MSRSISLTILVGCWIAFPAPSPSEEDERFVEGITRTFPEAPEPQVFRPRYELFIVDKFRTEGAFRILGECEETLVIVWEEEPGIIAGQEVLFADAMCFCPRYLFGLERSSGKAIWCQECGWSNSRMLRSEGGSFWHVQQSCEISLFAVQRRAADGAAVLAVDWSALPPMEMADAALHSTLHSAFGKEPRTCSFKRHLHSTSKAAAKAGPDGKSTEKEKMAEPPAEAEFLEGLILNDAVCAEGAIWLVLTTPPHYWNTYHDYLCAADLTRGIWAWYSLAAERVGSAAGNPDEDRAKLPQWGKPESPVAGIPAGLFPDRQVLGEDGRRYLINKGVTRDHKFFHEIIPIQAGRLDPGKKLVLKPSPPQEGGGFDKLEIYPWPPHLAAIWSSTESDPERIFVDLLSLKGDLVKRRGPFDVAAGSYPKHFDAQGDRAMLGMRKDMFLLARSAAPGQVPSLQCDRLAKTPIPLDGWETECRDLKLLGDRIYATIRLWRKKDEKIERKFCVVCWSARDGSLLWTCALK